MSESHAPQSSAPKRSLLGRLFSYLFTFLLVFVLVGNAIFICVILGGEAKHWNLPFVGKLDHRPVPAAAFKLEYGFVLEPVAPRNGDTYLFELQRKWAHRGVVGARSFATTVNILVVDRDTNANHWLFKGQNRAVLNLQLLYGQRSDGPEMPIVALAMVVAEADTNKNGEIGPGDRVSLYVYRMDGKAPEKVLSADHITLVAPLAAATLRVVYQNGKTGMVATYAVPSFKRLTSAPVIDLPTLATEVPAAFDNDED